jgi:putative ABC transport system substrate-binding protein
MEAAMTPFARSPLTALVIFGLSLATAPGYAGQHQNRVWSIGLIHVGLDHEPPSLPTLRGELRRLGYEEGKNLRFDWRNQPDEHAAHATAREFVRNKVDLIVAFEDQSVRAAKAATSQIPIVFVHVVDPVATGYVESLSRPGGNITGTISFQYVLAKRLELFKEIMPQLQRVLALVDPGDPITPRLHAQARRAAATLKLDLIEREVTTAADLERVFSSLKPGEADGVFVVSQTLIANFNVLILQLAGRAHLPVATHRREWVEQGALFSYAEDFAAAGRIVARYIDKIFNGAKPGDLAVEQPRELKLVISLKAAEGFGVKIPPSILIRADEVIE